MFERFSEQARAVVAQAYQEAGEAKDPRIGTEHLLLGLLAADQGGAAQALARRGVQADAVRAALAAARRARPVGEELDAEALSSLGIDLDTVREKVEATFGPGALDRPHTPARVAGSGWFGRLPFSPRARKVVELSLREAIAMHSKQIRSGHLLLGLLRDGSGLGARLLADAGVNLPELADEVRVQLRAE